MHGAGFAPAGGSSALRPSTRRFTLPVSGVCLTLAPFTGLEEILLAEGNPGDPALTLALASRMGLTEPAADWAELPVADADSFLLRLREAALGGLISASRKCQGPNCAERVEFSFKIGDYLAHHAPRQPRGRGWAAVPADPSGWYALELAGVAAARFRLPTLADQIAAYGRADGADFLSRICISAEAMPLRTRRKLEAAMECLAPALSGTLSGVCPQCGAGLEAQFDARRFCLAELKDRARFVYDDVDALAERYHWEEEAILALPQARRLHYAERARQAARGA